MVIAGGIAMLVGAIDPLEGSLAILPGSGLVALGTFLGHHGRRQVAYRVWAFILVAFGVGGLWALSSVGGFGGTSGLSMWWGVLILPYLFGWSLGMWAPGAPRWLSALGLVVGLWYLALSGLLQTRSSKFDSWALVLVLGAIGLMTVVGCITRLVIAFRNSQTPKSPASS